MATARYHVTPSGPKLCSASIRSCPYGGEENHFENKITAKQKFAEAPKTASQLHREGQHVSKYLSLKSEAVTQTITQADNWGSAVSDLIDAHIEKNSVKPEQIEFTLQWEEPSLDNDPEKARKFVFDASPRLDDSMGQFTNIYRLAWWSASDKEAQLAIDSIYRTPEYKDIRWEKIPDKMKWEAAFGAIADVADINKNAFTEIKKKERELQGENELNHRLILNTANVVDFSSLAKKLRDPNQVAIAMLEDVQSGRALAAEDKALYRYERSLDRKANNVVRAIQATENSLIGPYNAYDRGIGFYSLDGDHRTVVEENLSSTFVRGRHLHQLGLDSQRWVTGTWRGDKDGQGHNSLGNQARYERLSSSTDKGIPHQSPMTFWTANTPDGARWELGLDVSTPEAGSNRVRYFEAANPNTIMNESVTEGPIQGFASMKESMELRYGDSSKWTPGLQRDMGILADIVEGHNAMSLSAQSARERLEQSGFGKPTPEASAQEEHKSLFGNLSKLFG